MITGELFMRIWKALILFVFSLLLLLNIFVSAAKNEDTTLPNIELDSDEIHIGINDDRELLLEGVTAYDKKDGDLTGRVMIESISRFIEVGTAKVTYAVWDDDNHVAKASRKVIFDDYTTPEFYLRGSLIFSSTQNANALKYLGATDSIDGDISGRIIITSSDYAAENSSLYYVNARVTSSMGGASSIDLPVIIEERDIEAPTIVLSEYLKVIKVGENVDYRNNFVSAYVTEKNDDGEEIRIPIELNRIETDLDLTESGIYLVHYYAYFYDETGKEHRGHETLTVVVEEA